MLDDRDRNELVEIEHGLLLEDPELVGALEGASRHAPPRHHHGSVATTIAGLTLCAVLWAGPRPLTGPEVAVRGTAGPPRVTPPSPGATAIPVPRRPVPRRTRRPA